MDSYVIDWVQLFLNEGVKKVPQNIQIQSITKILGKTIKTHTTLQSEEEVRKSTFIGW